MGDDRMTLCLFGRRQNLQYIAFINKLEWDYIMPSQFSVYILTQALEQFEISIQNSFPSW